MSKRIEGAHVSFLRQVTHKQATQQRYRSWRQVPAEEVLQGAGTQAIRTYVVRQQETVLEWVAREWVRRRGDTLGAVLAEEGSGGPSEGHGGSDFGSDKSAATLGTRQA